MMKTCITNCEKSLWIVLLFVLPYASFSQVNYTIRGKVTSTTGELLIGATLNIGGTSQGTITDADGNYLLSGVLKAGDYTLITTYTGYAAKTQPITIDVSSSEQVVDLLLEEDAMNLDEVVVTGSTLRSTRRSLGNAINTIDVAQLEKTGTTNIVGALQGKIPGAQITQNSGDPYGGITIRLRGVKSILGSSDPLYIIDGVIISNSSANVSQTALSNQVGAASIGTNRLADINPNEIASINVINGAAAAAQYGSRAANGVVIINTKRGQLGKPKINFSTSVGVNELRKKLPIHTYGKQFGFAALRLHTISAVSDAQANANAGTTRVDIVRDGATTKLASNLVDVTRYDYQDLIYQQAMSYDNNLSMSGGTERTQYYLSLGYSNNEGIIKGTDFTRYNFRTRIDQRLTNWAKISAGLSYINSFANEKANGNVFYSPINSIAITNNTTDAAARDADGNLKAVEPTRVNPLSTIEDMEFSTSINRTVNDLQLNLSPLRNLTIDWVVGVDAYSQLGSGLIEAYPYQNVAGLPLERYPNGYASTTNNVVFQFNSDVNVTYDWKISQALNFKAIAGTNYQYFRSDFTRSSGEALAPFIQTVSGATTAVGTGYGLDRFSLSGEFIQGTLSYQNWIYLTGAVRRDRSSKFSEENTNQIYPKVSASFIPSDLTFWKNSAVKNAVSSLKLRFSWGEAGNLNGIGSYDRFWQFFPTPNLGRATLLPSGTLANPDVQPERMTETEGGIDISFFNDLLSVSATVYQQTINDLVVNRVLAPSTGGTSIVNSVGTMENRGLELATNLTVLKNKNFNWEIGVLFNRNRNEVTKLGSPSVGISNSAGAPVFLIEGQPASLFYGFPYARNADGSLLLTAQGLPQRERGTQTSITEFTPVRTGEQPSGAFVRAIIGDPNPDWTGSVSSSFSFKGLTLGFLLDAVQGVEVFNANKRTIENVGIGPLAEQELKGELPRGYIFSLVNIEEFRVDPGDFVKLREISLSYSFGKVASIFDNITLSLVGRNLYSWDNFSGQDPETNAGGNNDLLRGVDFGNVPIPRTYLVQLNVNF